MDPETDPEPPKLSEQPRLRSGRAVGIDVYRFPLLAQALAEERVEGFSRPNTGKRTQVESVPDEPLSESEQIRFGMAGEPRDKGLR